MQKVLTNNVNCGIIYTTKGNNPKHMKERYNNDKRNDHSERIREADGKRRN